MKKTYYFSHDYNASSDPKLICLINKYGGMGYGVYWRLIEMLYQETTNKLPLKSLIYESVASQMVAKPEIVENIINDCILRFEIFQKDDTFFWSERVLRQIEAIEEKYKNLSNIRSEAGKKGNEKRWSHRKTIANHRKPSQTSLDKIRIDKNRIDKNRIDKNRIDILQSDDCDINPLLNEFKEINPTINFGNITQRDVLKDLVKKFGYEKTLNTIKYAVSIQGQKYAPTITTPYQLKNKLGELIVFHKKENNSSTIVKI